MAEVTAHGLAVESPSGWEARVFRRAEHGEVNVEVAGAASPPGERSFPVVHVASIALPLDMADYGSDVVEDLGRDDALIILKEFDPADAAQPLFERDGMPRTLRPGQFDPAALQRRLDGQAGFQQFFHEGGRAFCLYVVLGDHQRRTTVVPRVNAVLATIVIDPLEVPVAPSSAPEPSTTTTTSTVPGRDMDAPSSAPSTSTTTPAGEAPDGTAPGGAP